MKKPFYKKWWFILIVAIIVLGAIGNAIGGDDKGNAKKDNPTKQEESAKKEVSAETKENKEPAKEEAKKEEKPKTPEERATAFVNKKLKDKTNNDKDRIVSVGVKNNSFEIILNGDDNFTTNMIRIGMISKSADLFEEVSKYEDITANDITIGWMMTLVDQYGNENDQPVLKVQLSKDKLAKINWKNFDYNNLENIADAYFVHPALKDK